MRLDGKTALITGGTSGIGLATARLFATEGASVVVTGRSEGNVDGLRAEAGDRVRFLRSDVLSSADRQAMAQAVADTFGTLDIFFANAGVARSTPLDSTDEDQYATVMDTNTKAVFFTMQAVRPLLARGASVVLNTSFLNQVGRSDLSLLSASKAAVRSLALSWSSELLDRDIRVNAVSPGPIDTPLQGRGRTPEEAARVRAGLASRVPVGHLGTADDIAYAALFLASDESRYVRGEELVVDGGISRLQI